ncbi:MAG: sigma-70 family RNA polymerase sigma factor [Planctomycetota bacterium]
MKDRSPDRGSADPMASDVPDLLRHTEGLRRLVRSLVRDGAEAEDVVQETMTVALRRIGRGEGDPGSAPAWLAGVARNLVRSRRRDRARRLEREGRAALDAGSEPSPSPDEDLELVERQRDLLRHVGALPAAQRRAVLARYYEGRTPAEIAAASGEPVATVKRTNSTSTTSPPPSPSSSLPSASLS